MTAGAAGGDLEQVDRGGVEGFQCLGGQKFSGGGRAEETGVLQHGDFAGEEEGVVGEVGGQEDSVAFGGEGTQDGDDAHLVGDVEAGTGFVEDQHRGGLGQGTGDQNELAFAAREFVEGAFGEMGDGQADHGGFGGGAVVAGGGSHEAEMGGSAHQHDVDGAEGEGGRGRLGDVGDVTGGLGGGEGGEVMAVHQDAAGVEAFEAEEAAEEGGLAGAVGAEEDEGGFRAEGEGEVGEQGWGVGPGEVEVFGLEHQNHCFRERARTRAKKGAPIRAVRMPRGISKVPVKRAMLSMPRRKPPPSRADIGRTAA